MNPQGTAYTFVPENCFYLFRFYLLWIESMEVPVSSLSACSAAPPAPCANRNAGRRIWGSDVPQCADEASVEEWLPSTSKESGPSVSSRRLDFIMYSRFYSFVLRYICKVCKEFQKFLICFRCLHIRNAVTLWRYYILSQLLVHCLD